MLRLSQSDLEATLHFLRQAEAVTGPDPFPSELLDVLRGLVPSEFVAYDELDLVERRVLIYVACTRGQEVEASQPDEEELDRNFLRLMHQHPICSHRLRTGDHTAHKFSDFVTRKQLHGLEIHAEYFRRYGVEFRMAVGLPGPPTHTKTLGFDRVGNRDFGERDRVLLNRLRPHLTALHAAARDRRRAAALLLGQDRAGIVVLLSPDQIDFATPAATRLLTRYFGTASDSRLPEPVRTWLHRDAVRLNGNGLPRATTVPLTVEHGNRRLTIRRAGQLSCSTSRSPR